MDKKDSIIKVVDMAVYSVTDFAKQQAKIRNLTFAVACLGLFSCFLYKHVRALEEQLKQSDKPASE